jgi:hypothetical protein
MTDDHDRIYYQINQAEKAITALDKQVALMAQSNEAMAKIMTDHMNLHKETRSTVKTSVINFVFTMLGLAVAGGVGAAIAAASN